MPPAFNNAMPPGFVDRSLRRVINSNGPGKFNLEMSAAQDDRALHSPSENHVHA